MMALFLLSLLAALVGWWSDVYSRNVMLTLMSILLVLWGLDLALVCQQRRAGWFVVGIGVVNCLLDERVRVWWLGI